MLAVIKPSHGVVYPPDLKVAPLSKVQVHIKTGMGARPFDFSILAMTRAAIGWTTRTCI